MGPDFNSVAEITNPRLHPVTSLQQVLYNNVSPVTSNLSSPQSAAAAVTPQQQQQQQYHLNQQRPMQRRSLMLPSDLDQSISSSQPGQSSNPQTPNTSSERIILEKNLEKLITEKGMEVLGQLTAEMTPQQVITFWCKSSLSVFN